MKTALFYLLQVTACSGILYGYYHLFLRNKRFHQYNRYFLLLTVVISIIIPFLQIPVYFDSEGPKPLLVKSLAVFSPGGFEEDVVISSVAAKQTWFTWKNVFSLSYVLIGLLLFIRFWVALIRVVRLIRIYPGEKIDNIWFINTDEPATPFSFFRWLFWNNKIELNSDNGQQIFRHELFHIRHKHSWDIIFLETITILFWVNPFFHLVKKEIKAIHEFLADKHAVEENKEWDYAELLLMQVLGSPNTRLTNPFFHNQIKRRIAMLTTSQKPGYQYLRKIMVLPLAAIIIGLFAFTYKNKFNNPARWQGETFTIVVDAGHGGDDPGASSPGGQTTEAALSLEIARTIKTLGKEYNIDVVMTRDNDKFPGNAKDKDEALKKRIELVKETNPAAFISVHMSMTPDASQKNHSGFEAYISKKRDDASVKLASAVLQNLSTVYKTRDEARIRETEGIYVLDKNSSPAIILECGYINNPDDLAFITNKNNQEKVARSILEGIVRYQSQSLQAATLIPQADTVPEKIIKKTAFISHPEKIILQADTIFFHPGTKTVKQDFSKSLIVINDKKYEAGFLGTNTIIADEVHIYGKGDPEAIGLYGKEAADGLLVFKNAKIIDQSPEDYYEIDFNSKAGSSNNKIFEKVEIEPTFQGGLTGWAKFLDRNMDRDLPVKKGAPIGAYTVFIQFIVNEDGDVSDIRPLTKHGYGMEEEAVRLIKKGPKWIPAIQNGHKVKAYKKQRFDFTITGNNTNPADVNPNKEVVVVGYAKQREPLEEVVVEGRSLHDKKPGAEEKSSQDKAVIVTDYLTKKGTGNKEIIVKGNPIKKIVFTEAEKQPYFPGGDVAWRKYLERNAKPNIPIDKGAPGGTYNVVVLFIVNTDGSISDIKPLTDHGYGMEEEALRLIKSSPHWIPAEQNGKKVNAYRKQPVTFQVVEEKEPRKIPEITLDRLKNTEPHALLGVAKEVDLTSYTFRVEYNGEVLSSDNKGNRHTASTMKLINQLSPGRIIIIESIVGMINGQQVKYPSRVYMLI